MFHKPGRDCCILYGGGEGVGHIYIIDTRNLTGIHSDGYELAAYDMEATHQLNGFEGEPGGGDEVNATHIPPAAIIGTIRIYRWGLDDKNAIKSFSGKQSESLTGFFATHYDSIDEEDYNPLVVTFNIKYIPPSSPS